ncbi:hypothetical protein PENNAL_c0096G00064 [Penicillium nalgiovense]|uniref:Uncharacterized protein n=1 Tax=Penicillium nalgiovense TaxID=60175 RepID=A0A1V6XBC9_PENNA|nr:hypothetical protein PENNAL_c0096G00064 [Penicillium nalgiovense]
MNCPSRTDDTLLHDEWNQNPPRFAPDLTTRQDLLGISNTRENKGDKNGLALLQNHSNWAHAHWPRISDLGKRLHGVGEASIGPLAPQKNLSIRHGELDLNKTPLSYQKFKDWALWLLSVLFISALISHNSLGNCFIPKAPLALETTFLAEQQDSQPAKRSSCAVGGVREAAYDLPLHVAALFIILGTSTIACAFPILATRFPRLHIPPSFLFFVSHFGTGVLIATAFVHLLPTAFQSLGDPCLSSFWTNDYPAMPGAIALAGVFFITVIEMKRSSSGPERDTLAQLDDYTSAEPRAQSSHSVTLDYQPHNQRKETMQVYLLEMGILFHSIFIGMSLSVSIGSEFVILLIAIVFHQTFEGLALGSRIASLSWSEKQLQPWFMSLAYGCTTPIGQAIGLATHTLYSPDSEVGLLVVGIMNAISAGLLIFASLVELMSEDFLSDESWRILRGRRRVYAFLLVCLGAFCMSIVGAWA